ncbi:MAG TPA: 4Fe-4S dicluster domain-containing protein [Dehalococcoidia bacterium]|nr:4Fe-4S dicluster domain-containing protein [Dehalococcoidia bacterium]
MDVFTVNEETCTKCGVCADVCHLGIIDFQKNSFPKPFPEISNQMCSKCSACLIVCPNESFIHRDVSYEECPKIDSTLNINYEQCTQLLKTRRSVRTFKDTPVPRDVVLQAIEAARFSPTGNNVQNIQWLIIDDRDMVENLRKAGNEWLIIGLKSTQNLYTPLVDIWEKQIKDGDDIFLRGAPAIVSTYIEQDNSIGASMGAYVCSISLAYFNLAAISLGLECCWEGFFSVAADTYPPIKDAISLPEEYKIIGSMVVGYPKYKYKRIPMRNQAQINWR